MQLPEKYLRELQWWQREVSEKIVPWYRGDINEVWGILSPECTDGPSQTERIDAVNIFSHAALYYQDLLAIDPGRDHWNRVLDVGCGPLLPGLHIPCNELWCVDPLLEHYYAAGFPVRNRGAVLIPCFAENMWPLPSNMFDVVVSHNAIDHVDDFERAVSEIERVAKVNATIRFTVTYHKPTFTEPMELTDDRIRAAFSRRVNVMRGDGVGETLWST